MKEKTLNRREFIKTAAAAGMAMTIPSFITSKVLAFPTDESQWPLNDTMIRRLTEASLGDSFEFIFCADVHVPFDDRGTFQTIIKKANELGAAFVLFGGDCVQVGNTANYKIFLRELKKFKMPVICAIGNHDTSFEDYSDQREWKKRFGVPHFRFDAGGLRIIALNNANHFLLEEDYLFLEESLRTDLSKIVTMHRPVNYLNPLYETPMEDKTGRFRALVEKGGVTAVLTGHEHHYGFYEINGVKYIVSGGAGGRLNDNTENNFHHFLLIKAGKKTFNFNVEKI
ncbi:MAG: metallophosphoesterase [bacterium]